MDGSLATTNMWLAVMAVVSVLEALLLVALGIGGLLVYRRLMTVITDLEARQVEPLRVKVDGILADVKDVTARVSEQTARVDLAIAGTMDRMDETAERMRDSIRDRIWQGVAVVRGLQAALAALLADDRRREPPAAGAGRASRTAAGAQAV